MRQYLILLLLVVVVSGFQPTFQNQRLATARHGIFDKFIESMEAGYKGEDSAYQKQKAFDENKRAEQRKRADERKSRGYTELKNVQGKKTLTKLKYEEEPEPPKEEKKFFGLF